MSELKEIKTDSKQTIKPLPPESVIGIFGGGQLGRMTAQVAARLGYDTHIFCPKDDSPAFHVSRYYTKADYKDEQALTAFAQSIDVVTFEFENVPYETVKLMKKIVPVRPNWEILHLAQNRIREKEFVRNLGFKTADFCIIRTYEDLHEGINTIGKPCVLKTTEMGYDGKGQLFIDENTQIDSFNRKESILEAYIPFDLEISSIVARRIDGTTSAFDVVQNCHKNGVLDTTFAPAKISQKLADEAIKITTEIAHATNLIGILAVEFFVTKSGELLFNEMAPRPHNSGHWTLDGCQTCQFEQFVRAVTGLPFGSPQRHSMIKMKNLIDNDINNLNKVIQDPHAKIHLYGKESVAPGRKMGHVNYIL